MPWPWPMLSKPLSSCAQQIMERVVIIHPTLNAINFGPPSPKSLSGLRTQRAVLRTIIVLRRSTISPFGEPRSVTTLYREHAFSCKRSIHNKPKFYSLSSVFLWILAEEVGCFCYHSKETSCLTVVPYDAYVKSSLTRTQ